MFRYEKFDKRNQTITEKVLTLWNSNIGEDYPLTRELLIQNTYEDENLFNDGSFLVWDNDRLVAFIFTKLWNGKMKITDYKKTGWIQVVLVDESYRNKGIGTQLLKRVEEEMKKRGKRRILLGRDTFNYFPGVPARHKRVKEWFLEKGYINKGKVYDLFKKYDYSNDCKKIDYSPYNICILKKYERDKLISFLKRAFPGRWEYEAVKYFEKGGTGREFLVARESDKIIGFCRVNDSDSKVIGNNVNWKNRYNGKLGGIGPIGVDKEYKRKGIGKSLIEYGVSMLNQRGIENILIDWTTLTDYYSKFGFEISESYYQLEKFMKD
jgi:GNAT superfamily N-acetyltransferase